MRVSLTLREPNTNFDVTFKFGSLQASSLCVKEMSVCTYKQTGSDAS